MPRRKQSNINPENIGQAFWNGKDYYTLDSCQSEPQATFTRLYDKDNPITRPISEFKDFVMVKPVGKITKKQEPSFKERKPRSDKGTKKKQSLTEALQQEEKQLAEERASIAGIAGKTYKPEEKPNTEEVYVHTPAEGETEYQVAILGKYYGTGVTLKEAMTKAAQACPDIIYRDISPKSITFIEGILES